MGNSDLASIKWVSTGSRRGKDCCRSELEAPRRARGEKKDRNSEALGSGGGVCRRSRTPPEKKGAADLFASRSSLFAGRKSSPAKAA